MSLTLPAAAPERPRVQFTVGQLLSMQQTGLLYGPYGERHIELIGGELIEMPAPGPIHDTVSQRLQDLLAPLGNGRLRVEKGLSIPDYDMPIPDLVVLHAAVEWRMVEPADCLWMESRQVVENRAAALQAQQWVDYAACLSIKASSGGRSTFRSEVSLK